VQAFAEKIVATGMCRRITKLLRENKASFWFQMHENLVKWFHIKIKMNTLVN